MWTADRLKDQGPIRMSHEESKLGLRYLFEYASKYKPDHIVGINRGGVLLSAAIVIELQIITEKFTRCMIVTKKGKLECDNKNIKGRVLVIDDISRTGGTLEMAINFLKNFKNIQSINTAVILTCLDDNNEPVYKDLNFSAFATLNCNAYLPWTKKMSRVERDQKSSNFVNELKDIPLEKLAKEIRKRGDPDIDIVPRRG